MLKLRRRFLVELQKRFANICWPMCTDGYLCPHAPSQSLARSRLQGTHSENLKLATKDTNTFAISPAPLPFVVAAEKVRH